MEERERRIVMNEALFREVNERIEELAQSFAHPETLDLICECGNASCASRIEMDRDEYEHVRSDSTTFAIVKTKAVEGWPRVTSKDLGAELEKVARGQFDFGRHYNFFFDEETED